jgi:hypothetical protein
MDSTYYVTVFDAAQLRSPAPVVSAISVVVLVAAVAALIVWRRRARPSGLRAAIASPIPLICVAAIAAAPLVILFVVLEASLLSGLQNALASGRYLVVEGPIQDFVPGDRGGHQYERFSVVTGGRTHSYWYTHGQSEPGFHRSAGPMRAGMHVRIADVDGHIARLEVKQGPGHPVLPARYRWVFTSADPVR